MYVIEITEDKFDDAIEHMTKGIKCLSKAVEMFEEMKESSRHDGYDERFERSRHRMVGYDYPDMDRDQYRSGGGRYGRY